MSSKHFGAVQLERVGHPSSACSQGTVAIDTVNPPVETNNTSTGVQKLATRCERRGQLEIGIVTHYGQVFAAFGSSVIGHNVTGYTRNRKGSISLTRWDGSTMLDCRSEVIRQFRDGSIALMFRLTNGRFIVGYALGDDGMLFRGELADRLRR